ncbi:MAG: M48 family metalloprotease, partial [Candidatus Aminicenantales bacterium]
CSVVQQSTDVLKGSGAISADQANTIQKTSEVVRGTFGDISEQEEYYIGRSVAALILSRYPVLQNPALTRYINTMGNAIALYSDRPETFAGYHFLVLDTDEVNALAAPGGLVFLTKGLIKRCQDEDTLALILAHEIGHVNAKHGLQSIKKSRLVDAFKLLGTAAVKTYAPDTVAKLTGVFEDTLGDIVGSLVERGYDRKFEYEADGLAVKFAGRAHYDTGGLTRFLKTMVGDASAASGKGWFKTHPAPQDRIANASPAIAALGPVKIAAVRTARFKQAVAGLK